MRLCPCERPPRTTPVSMSHLRPPRAVGCRGIPSPPGARQHCPPRAWYRAPRTARHSMFIRARCDALVARRVHAGYVRSAKTDDALVGVFNFSEIVHGAFQSAYLGYFAFAPQAGKGLMSEGWPWRSTLRFANWAASRGGEHPAQQCPFAGARHAHGLHPRGIFAPLREDRWALARPRALRDACRGLASAAAEAALRPRGRR